MTILWISIFRDLRISKTSTKSCTERKHFEADIDLPGFKKEQIKVQLEDGYLTVSAEKGLDKDEKDKKGKLIRQERYSGAMSRSFYVGDSITQEDVKAKFENGVLKLEIPKKEPQKQLPESKYIAIA